MSQTVLDPVSVDGGTYSGRWMTVIHNNDFTPFDVVIAALMEATNCSYEEASIEAWEAHHRGKAAVHFSSKNECERAAAVINRVGVTTDVVKEWDD